MPSEHALLLVRVAAKLPGSENDSDRAALLAWAGRLLAGEGDHVAAPSELTSGRSGGSLGLPLPIYKVYKHARYEALLLPGWHVLYGGREYRTPSAAAIALTGTNQNGWRFWRYREPYVGIEHTIDRLRETTGVKLAATMAATQRFVNATRRGVAALERSEQYRLRT